MLEHSCGFLVVVWFSLHTTATARWTKQWSEEHSTAYYFDTAHGESSWEKPDGVLLDAEPDAEPTPAAVEGWTDCTMEAQQVFRTSGLKRAWRLMARESHPDKGGSGDRFQGLADVRDYLRSPLRFFAWKTLHHASSQPHALAPFGSPAAAIGTLRTAHAWLGEDAGGWPRLSLEAELNLSANLSAGHTWRVAFAGANASTIEYKGDEGSGGYDPCCHFKQRSVCELRPRDDVLERLANATTVGATGEQAPLQPAWFEQRTAHYVTHDCPLPPVFNVSVSKPLHLKAAGRWVAVLIVQDREEDMSLCAAVALRLAFQPRPPTRPPPLESATGAAHFVQQSSGRSCRDGADLLEGPLDAYTDCDDETRVCVLTRKCRARCAKRKACRFYTTWPSGHCQLSSQCTDEAPSSERGCRTFRKSESVGESVAGSGFGVDDSAGDGVV